MAAEGKGVELFQDALRSIFDPFFAEDGLAQDSGIYLMAGFFIAYHHGGKISARAANGKGKPLTLTFPVDPPAGQAPEEGDLLSRMLVNESMWEKILLEN
jgi:K+-sensing histidine kinase KdpD